MYLTDRINSELSFESVSIKCFYGSLINSGSDFWFRSSNHLTDQIPILAYSPAISPATITRGRSWLWQTGYSLIHTHASLSGQSQSEQNYNRGQLRKNDLSIIISVLFHWLLEDYYVTLDRMVCLSRSQLTCTSIYYHNLIFFKLTFGWLT